LLLCGDFQALRNRHDFASLAVPPKYHQLGTFHEYYSGKRRAPVLTLVIGGNHEASNYMWELFHGGWLAENIYYLGAAGCVNVGGLRIAGASGIYKDHDYNKGHFETVPYNSSTLRSAYHIRSYDVNKLMLVCPRFPCSSSSASAWT
jgi:lariat debranching enzyme